MRLAQCVRRRGAFLAALVPLVLLLSAGQAQAADCVSSGIHTSNWSDPTTWTGCNGGVPGAADTATVSNFALVQVDANHAASSLTISAGGSVGFTANDPTVNVGALNAGQGVITGNGTVTSSAGMTKSTASTFNIVEGADVVLNGASSIADGGICLRDDGGGDPSLRINAAFTIASTSAAQSAFLCDAGADVPHIFISATGSLIDQMPGDTFVKTRTDNDGLIRAAADVLQLQFGTATASSSGDYEATSGNTLRLDGTSDFNLGSGASLTGAGRVVAAAPINAAAGATIDPSTLESAFATLTISGLGTYSPTTLILTGGVIDSTRDASVAVLDARDGVLGGNHTLTVASLTKTTAATLGIRDGADVVLNGASTVSAGAICLGDFGGGVPSLRLNAALTIPAGHTFQCNAGLNVPVVLIQPGGSLGLTGAGTWDVTPPVRVAGGVVSVASGQTLNLEGGTEQTAGATTVASGGTLHRSGAYTQTGGTYTVASGATAAAASSAIAGGTLAGNGALTSPVTLTSTGVLSGGGQITGDVANTSGSVRPGASPGTLGITGNYTQGSAGTLQVDVAGTTPGTGFDRLNVSGAATLDGTVAVVKGAGFDPQPTDTFQFLTSASRTGTFSALTGNSLPSGKTYALDYPDDPLFGARLTTAQSPPSNTTAPSIPSSRNVGQAVTCNPGSWTASPTSFDFSWTRDGMPIANELTNSYTLRPGDAGHTIRCRVVAHNAGGASQPATSNGLSVTNLPPSSTGSPTIPSTGKVGTTVTCKTGTWTGSPTSFAFSWTFDGSSIANQHGSTYKLGAGDAAHEIRCVVVAHNAAGHSAPATSNALTVKRPPSSCRDVTLPKSAINKPKAAFRDGKLFLKGTASDVACGKPGRVVRVIVTIARHLDPSGGPNRCRFLLESGRGLGPVRGCDGKPPIVFPATGTTKWSLTMTATPPKATYTIRARAIDAAGNVQAVKSTGPNVMKLKRGAP